MDDQTYQNQINRADTLPDECEHCGHWTFAALTAKLAVATEALGNLKTEVLNVVEEVNQLVLNRDFQTARHFLEGEGTNGHTTESLMTAYADYAIDQTIGDIRWIGSISRISKALEKSDAALAKIQEVD
jgi:hypothetical protein